MSGFFTLLWLIANVVMIIFIIKTVKEKDKEAKKGKRKVWLISLAAAFVCLILIGVTSGGTESSESNETTEEEKNVVEQVEPETEKIEEPTPEPEEQSKEFEVTMNVNARKEGNGVLFDIETNLPDEAVLMLTLSKGDYNTDDSFTAQTKVTVKGGKATSDAFSAKGEPLNGDFDLSISMSLPSTQSDAVRKVIGENGENMTGGLVEQSSIGSSNVVSALYTVSIGDDVEVTPSDDYTQTIFREETDEEEPLDTETSGSDSDAQANKEFISEHETDIVVAASLALDNFLDKKSYKMSLAPQNWTIAKFDETETTVIGMTDITYNGQKGKYIYVGTLNINGSGEVESAKPHYLEVNGQVLGDDGYCDDVFDKIKSLGN